MVFPNRSSNRGGRRRGAAAAELVVLAPLLLFVLIVAIDFCRLFFALHNYHQCRPEWRSGPATRSLTCTLPSQSPYANVQDAALADANNLNPALTAANVTSSTGTDGQGNDDGERYRTISV